MNRLLRLLVSAGLIGFLVARLDWAPMADAVAGLRVDWALGALALFLATPFVASYRWQLLARPLGFEQSLRQFTGIYFVGMYFNLLLPTSVGGDVVRAWYLDGGRNQKLSAVLCVLVDRATGLLTLIAMACVATLFQLDALPSAILFAVWAVGALAAGGLLVLPWVARLSDRLFPAVSIAPAPGRWAQRLRKVAAIPAGVLAAMGRYRGRPGLIAYTCSLSLGIMAANVVVVWMLSRSLGGTVPGGYFWVAGPVVTLLTLVPISVNGVGVREAGLGFLLAEAGAPASLGVTVGVLLFGLYLVAGLIGAGVYLLGSFPRLAAVEDDADYTPGPAHLNRAA